jgi:hypothetical protein
MTLRAPAHGVVLVTIDGRDVGELGDAPFRALAQTLAESPLDLFIDARNTTGASVNVSAEWSQWLQQHRAELRSIHMLTGSKFIQLTADFVRRFAQLGERMRIYTDAASFEQALTSAVTPH